MKGNRGLSYYFTSGQGRLQRVAVHQALDIPVGWVERSEPHHESRTSWWGSLRSTHPTTLFAYAGYIRIHWRFG
jgi:hypothetical protein